MGHFYFVQISDTHFGNASHYKYTKKIVESINRLPFKIEFVVHTGDIMADNIEDAAVVDKGIQILKALKVPIHFLPGNHDILVEKPLVTHKLFVQYFGPLSSLTIYRNVAFVFLYTEPLRRPLSINGFSPLAQLEELLRKASGKPVIVFHHAPSVGNFFNNARHRGWKKELQKDWVRLLNEHHVQAVIAGHFHRDELHWLGQVPLYISSSVATYWGRQPSYRIYEYTNGHIGYRTQYLE